MPTKEDGERVAALRAQREAAAAAAAAAVVAAEAEAAAEAAAADAALAASRGTTPAAMLSRLATPAVASRLPTPSSKQGWNAGEDRDEEAEEEEERETWELMETAAAKAAAREVEEKGLNQIQRRIKALNRDLDEKDRNIVVDYGDIERDMGGWAHSPNELNDAMTTACCRLATALGDGTAAYCMRLYSPNNYGEAGERARQRYDDALVAKAAAQRAAAEAAARKAAEAEAEAREAERAAAAAAKRAARAAAEAAEAALVAAAVSFFKHPTESPYCISRSPFET